MAEHGVVLPTRGSVMASDDGADLAARTRADVVGLARRAESMGLDSVWVGDSVVAKPRHEPLTTLAAVAGATDTVTLGTGVYLPVLRDPLHVAHATATLDVLAGGRFALGVGVGSVRTEYAALDRPWAERGVALDETLDVVTALWSGDAVTYDGAHASYTDVSLGFAPPRRPPVYVGSAVHPEKGLRRPIRRRVVAHGDGWFPVRATPADVALGRRQLEAALDAAGREPSLEVLLYQDVVVDDDPDAALAAGRRFIEAYYPGLDPSDDELRRRGSFGPAEAVDGELARYVDAGVDHFVTRFAAPDQADQLERYADLVA